MPGACAESSVGPRLFLKRPSDSVRKVSVGVSLSILTKRFFLRDVGPASLFDVAIATEGEKLYAYVIHIHKSNTTFRPLVTIIFDVIADNQQM